MAALARSTLRLQPFDASKTAAIVAEVFPALGLQTGAAENGGVYDGSWSAGGDLFTSVDPSTNVAIGQTRGGTVKDFERVLGRATDAKMAWRMLPAPQRGNIVRQMRDELAAKITPLGKLVSLETGKILAEGIGEIQEYIDVCDYAVGLSRTLSGPTLQSERPMHRMMEQWHPLGPIGVITAFNFPVAVWSWNSALAFVCGDPVVWKPSSKTPLCAIACQNIIREVLRANGVPDGVSCVVVGRGSTVGERIVADSRLILISATGSTRMGKRIGQVVGARMGRTILELGGNNALIISDKADLTGALASAFFGAVGTAGQRCTSTRRLIIHESVYDSFVQKLIANYEKVKIGDPLDPKTLMGPLIDEEAVSNYEKALAAVHQQGGTVLCGGKVLDASPFGRRTFVLPTIVEIRNDAEIVQTETFAPILYVMKYRTIDEAIALHNAVPQGLSSGIFTDSMAEAERFLSFKGSDCGIANVNVGTSGSEIGGAFGGEKETGGGRESGSDSWKAYMRRQSNTVNWGGEIHLAQGVEFHP